jgi:hypothetical protein
MAHQSSAKNALELSRAHEISSKIHVRLLLFALNSDFEYFKVDFEISKTPQYLDIKQVNVLTGNYTSTSRFARYIPTSSSTNVDNLILIYWRGIINEAIYSLNRYPPH